MAKKIYEVKKDENGYSVRNIEDNTVVAEGIRTKKEALKQKSEFTKAYREAAAQEAEAEPEPTAEVEVIEVDRGEKVKGITKANYKANMARAGELKHMLLEHFQSTQGFPSHRFIQQTWGFNISLKAIIRHKRKVLESLGLDPMSKVPTTTQLPRPKKQEVEAAA